VVPGPMCAGGVGSAARGSARDRPRDMGTGAGPPRDERVKRDASSDAIGSRYGQACWNVLLSFCVGDDVS
jgi:hypothetical protein